MFKKNIAGIFISLILTMGLFATGSSMAAGLGLKLATLAPDGTILTKALRAASDEIKAETDGRVYLKIYTGGVMGSDPQVMRKMRVGQLHGATLTAGSLGTEFRDYGILSMPMLLQTLDEVDAVREAVEPRLIEGLKKKGYISPGIMELGFVYIMSNSPLSNGEDIKNVKPWIPEGNEMGRRIFEAYDVSATPLPVPDVLTGLQTGIVDTVFSSPVAALALQWFTKVKYMTDQPILYSYGSLVLSEKAWKKIPEQDREVVFTIIKKHMDRVDKQSRADDANAKMTLQNQGIELVQMDPTDFQELKTVCDNLINESRDDGEIDANLLAEVRAIVESVRCGN